MRKIAFLFIFLGFGFYAFAQNTVLYDIEPAIDKIQGDYISKWGQIQKISGYRIQILAITGTNSKAQADGAKATFEVQFPEIPAYLTYVEPYFRIRVGNFSSRIEAYKVLQSIQWQYPSAYIIPDKIEYFNY